MKKLVLDGKKLLQIRKERNLTREELGKMLGLNEPSIFKWENGINQPRIKRIKDLCHALKIAPENLFIWQETETHAEKIIKEQNLADLFFTTDKKLSFTKNINHNEFIDSMIKHFCEFDCSNFSFNQIVKILLSLKK